MALPSLPSFLGPRVLVPLALLLALVANINGSFSYNLAATVCASVAVFAEVVDRHRWLVVSLLLLSIVLDIAVLALYAKPWFKSSATAAAAVFTILEMPVKLIGAYSVFTAGQDSSQHSG